MSNVTRLSQYARVPKSQWKELQPRIVVRNIGYAEFNKLMTSDNLVAVVVLATHQTMEGDMACGEVSYRNSGDYELIYRDELTGKLEQRKAYNVEEVIARRALELRLDLLSAPGCYVNPSLIAKVWAHGDVTMIAPNFADGAYSNERIKLPVKQYSFKYMLEQHGYGFDGETIAQRPQQPPRRPTRMELYQQAMRAKDAPKIEW